MAREIYVLLKAGHSANPIGAMAPQTAKELKAHNFAAEMRLSNMGKEFEDTALDPGPWRIPLEGQLDSHGGVEDGVRGGNLHTVNANMPDPSDAGCWMIHW